METPARRGTAAAVTATVLLALPTLVVLPALVSILGVSSAPGDDLAPVAAGLLWLALAALPLLAWARQSWKLAVPALAIAVVGVGYGVWGFIDGVEKSRQNCHWVLCDAGLYLGPVLAGYFVGVAVTLALLVHALRRVPAVGAMPA
ncbi:hypothetical protein KZX45_09860 [Georgenia sp. EYE_87]|uniref:hypothetical protein n=1 Tax=Georgenia sp. EYE_87 TaxID=2853448 RepID=UPI00200458DC|nr:hypothetical protein [Georgenia sp. EYE_87]MCK6210846.1 hypothetical protein [Georgenia sp. EYE_87]